MVDEVDEGLQFRQVNTFQVEERVLARVSSQDPAKEIRTRGQDDLVRIDGVHAVIGAQRHVEELVGPSHFPETVRPG